MSKNDLIRSDIMYDLGIGIHKTSLFFGNFDFLKWSQTVIKKINIIKASNRLITAISGAVFLFSFSWGLVLGTCSAQGISINSTGTAPNTKALLDISSTTGGLLIPRMTTTERNAITPPIPESLLIYNTTTRCFEAWDQTSTTWVAFGCIGCIVPTAVTASAAPNPICVGSTLTLTGGATNAISWNWTGPNSFTSTLQSPTIVGITTAGIGIYTLTASNTCGSATAVSTASVTVTILPVATFSYTGTPYCNNAANPSPTFSGGGVAGTFSSTAGLVFVSTSTGQVNLTTSTAGTYTVTNTIAAAGGCGVVTATSGITVNASTIWYQDTDGDSYGNPSVTASTCTQPAGYVANNTDCYDANTNAYPGQTSYFTTNRGDGSFDYNCDGSATKDDTKNCLTTFPVACTHLDVPGPTYRHGGYASTIPACGVSDTWWGGNFWQEATGCNGAPDAGSVDHFNCSDGGYGSGGNFWMMQRNSGSRTMGCR